MKETNQLRSQYGDDIILYDEQDESTVYRILAEFKLGEQGYAVIQSDELKKEEEVAIFKVSVKQDGELELETIEDDDEWETVSELYDEMTFPADIE
ncbi:DUF1292 domain-containing protein [Paenibacillus thalictri]|uniref:DUF1292 domain-containing protein n=1 Tax=Paenibacillus thalictri TaxID=2527873 RepID=A0A4Q9DXL7_9BACL|nr:DUF1292 domain-containing protein [Paenibacillus thalictri]TBL81859.1 DUF1292 domain-containing protein [Paenibacillus thalictri]